MKLVNMKRTEKPEMTAKPMEACGDAYPYGLNISLDHESLKKLGMEKLPEVGKTLTLTAKVEVTSVSMNESKGGGEYKSLSLQITDMSLGKQEKDSEEVKKKLYGDS